jgi:hypothetical protein
MSKLRKNKELLTKAARALFRWGRSGFKIVDKKTLGRRKQACLACPHLQEPVEVLQTALIFISSGNAAAETTGNKVCGVCGCHAGKKMQLASEACPATDPADAGLTRWGEPVLLKQ